MKRPTAAFWSELERISRELDSIDYYELLGVPREADASTIRAHYERQLRALHPDRHLRKLSPERRKMLGRVFARVGQAMTVLGHPQQRQRYDAKLAGAPVAASTGHGRPDPFHPQARQLLQEALADLQQGNTQRAKSKLQLAQQYAPQSAAIANALSVFVTKPQAPPAQASTGVSPSSQVATASTQLGPSNSSPKSPGPPRRERPRLPMGREVKVTCKTWKQVEHFYVQNLSETGMYLRCHTSEPVGTVLGIVLLLPDSSELKLRGTIVRQVRAESVGERPGVGIRFGRMSEQQSRSLQNLLRAVGGLALVEQSTAKPVASMQETSVPESSQPSKVSPEASPPEVLALIRNGRYRDACSVLQAEMGKAPENRELRALFFLASGLTAQAENQTDLAEHHFQRALRQAPDSEFILQTLRESSM